MNGIEQAPTDPPAPALVPRRRVYYGYIMLPIATMAGIASSPAQTFGISAFNESLRTSLDLSHSQLTGAYMLGTFLASLPLTWIGAFMDRHTLRRSMTVIVVLFGAICMASSLVTGLVSLFFAFLLLRMMGQGALSLVSGNTLPFWFRKRLGTVEGIRHLGMALAIAVVPAINLFLIHQFGWRWAWVILGLTVWAVMLPLTLLVRSGPWETGQHVDGEPHDPQLQESRAEGSPAGRHGPSFTFAQVRRTRPFWIVGAMTALWSMTNTAVLFNIVPLFRSRGLTEQHVALLFTGFAISLAIMQLVGGVMADRYPLHRLLCAAAIGLALSMGMVWQMTGPAMVIPLALMMGVSQGLLTSATGPLWPRYYGTAQIGRIRGALTTCMVAASSAGPFVLGLCVDFTGSYDFALLLFTVLPIPLIHLSLLAVPPGEGGRG